MMLLQASLCLTVLCMELTLCFLLPKHEYMDSGGHSQNALKRTVNSWLMRKYGNLPQPDDYEGEDEYGYESKYPWERYKRSVPIGGSDRQSSLRMLHHSDKDSSIKLSNLNTLGDKMGKSDKGHVINNRATWNIMKRMGFDDDSAKRATWNIMKRIYPSDKRATWQLMKRLATMDPSRQYFGSPHTRANWLPLKRGHSMGQFQGHLKELKNKAEERNRRATFLPMRALEAQNGEHVLSKTNHFINGRSSVTVESLSQKGLSKDYKHRNDVSDLPNSGKHIKDYVSDFDEFDKRASWLPTRSSEVDDEIVSEVRFIEDRFLPHFEYEELDRRMPTNRGLHIQMPTDPELHERMPTDRGLHIRMPTDRGIDVRMPTDRELHSRMPTERELEARMPTNRDLFS